MTSDIEDLTGVALTATVAFHPTIEALGRSSSRVSPKKKSPI